jgi:uncharacterized protein YodC (DUF2158 family)
MLELEVGSTVSLSIKKSPEMLVESIDKDTVVCLWFNESNELQTASFNISLLCLKKKGLNINPSMLDAM